MTQPPMVGEVAEMDVRSADVVRVLSQLIAETLNWARKQGSEFRTPGAFRAWQDKMDERLAVLEHARAHYSSMLPGELLVRGPDVGTDLGREFEDSRSDTLKALEALRSGR